MTAIAPNGNGTALWPDWQRPGKAGEGTATHHIHITSTATILRIKSLHQHERPSRRSCHSRNSHGREAQQ
ncbi:hypothetical protein THAOC_04965 [Thalassiosira oceanica]|uniref:Uncharacterized protein n=1 Tax=Thalassiosira oceanica TaxID=159749 RepID=K0TND0_THAOC|nr:hypothetical protein THAOC_04965 [Thalassiosira oceanica]|eukprot:EJK73412.1 hypothetical protein THAOC_04965 [Thalassiosira oceanica]